MQTNHWLNHIAPTPRPGRGQGEESYLTFTSHQYAIPNWTEPLRVIYDHELVLFSEGRFVVEIEGQRYPCSAGSFIIIPPARWQASWETAGRPGHRYWSHFDWQYRGSYVNTPIMTFSPARPQEDAFRRAPDFVPPVIFHGRIPSPPRAYDLADRLIALQTQGSEHDRIVSRALLLELILELLDPHPRKNLHIDRRDDLAHQVRDLLEQNLADHSRLRIQDLMEERLGYSYGHLCRAFKARYGIPPLKYLNAVCISRAKLLLRDTDLPIKEIARRLGFRDPLYFSQLFRQATRRTPSRFRQDPANDG